MTQARSLLKRLKGRGPLLIGTRPPHRGSDSGNTPEFRRLFLKRVHQLLKLGYDRLTPADCCGEQEETITGFLVKAIEGVLDDPTEDWMWFIFPDEESRVHDRLRKGKKISPAPEPASMPPDNRPRMIPERASWKYYIK